jgi:hypothetical protein
MPCNLSTNKSSLQEAFSKVSDTTTGREWAIFEYDGNSTIVKVGETGDGGLPELLESLDTAKVQYGFTAVKCPGLSQYKVLLIHWQGASVPVTKLSSTVSNVNDIKEFVKKVNITVYARSEEDIDLNSINSEVSKLSASRDSKDSGSTMFEIPAPLTSSYTPVKPHTDIDLQEREKFWKEQQAEEEQRRREEIKKNEEKSKLFQMERKQLETKLHETHLNSAKSPPSTPTSKPPPPSSQQQKKSALISGRTQMFEQRAQELADTRPVVKPKNFKYEVAVTKPLGKSGNKENGTTTTASNSSGGTSVNGSTENIDFKSTAEIRKQFAEGILISPTSSSPKSSISSASSPFNPPPSSQTNGNKNDMPSPPPLPTSPPPPTNRVIALWDYQANEGNEISFDPDDIITDVEKVHDGWWKGRAPNGQIGLFPSNFVKPL